MTPDTPAFSAAVTCSRCGTSTSSDAQFCQSCGNTLRAQTPAAGYPPSVYVPPTMARAPQYCGFWIRVVAAIVDAIAVGVALTPVKLMIGGAAVMGSRGAQMQDVGPILVMASGLMSISIVANWLYEAFMTSSKFQATLGKMIFGMKVVDTSGCRISFARASGRHFAKILSTVILFIGFIMVGLTQRKQGLHDMIADTLVLR